MPCNTVFLDNFSIYFCVHCYQTRVLVLLLVTDMYQYPHPLILFHLFTQVTFTVSRPLHTIQIYLISHVSVSSVMVENTEAKLLFLVVPCSHLPHLSLVDINI